MKRKFVYVLGLFVLFSSVLYARVNPVMAKASGGTGAAKTHEIELLWNSSMQVNDVAVSKDGNYIAAVNNTGVYYFASNDSNPKWWYLLGPTLSVAISTDGEYVVAGGSDGYIHYFNDSRAITGERISPTWKSVYLGGSVERGTLDMSDDGEYVVVGGTGVSLYYFAGCRERSGSDETYTWNYWFAVYDFLAVHISSDGRYVAAGGYNYPSGGFVIFYKDANATPYPTEPNWYATSSINSSIIDLAVSNDGYAAVAIDYAHLYYWANATSLSGDPNATWTADGSFFSLDMSSDGDEVIGGMGLPMPCGLHFWTGARMRSGPNQAEDWVRFEGSIVWGVAISNDGGIIAASVENASSYKALFFKSDGSMIGEFDLLQFSPFVSMSGDGNVVAVAGPGYDSLYVFIPEFPPMLIVPLFMIATLLALILLRKRKHLIAPKERINQQSHP